METINIKNFGSITDAFVEVNKLLVLIGHQASGKSTISKLIYFFKSLSTDFFARVYSSERDNVVLFEDLLYPTRVKFYDFFGSTFHLRNFEIVYTYPSGCSVVLTLDEEKKLHVEFSKDFLSSSVSKRIEEIKGRLRNIKSEQDKNEDIAKKVALQQQEYTLLLDLMNTVNGLFGTTHNDALYVLAGRNATVGYSETFERQLNQDLKKRVENRASFAQMGQTVEEILMVDFMERVQLIRRTLQKEGSIEGVIANASNDTKPLLIEASKFMFHVLRGQYAQSEYGEKLVFRGGSVYLKDASSGQQESIRILLDAFLSISQRKAKTAFRVVEEPEAHIYPEAQKYAIQMLILALNSNPDNQLVITTHSPYTLTVLNNLLYASTICKVRPELKEQVNKEVNSNLWVDDDSIAVYMLKNGHCEDIMDRDVKMIKAELIDDVSSVLNEEYDKLQELEYECQPNNEEM
jgi:predicted ATP-dependent endonuclease of OLD family